MVRLGTAGFLTSFLTALVVFPILTFATPVYLDGIDAAHAGSVINHTTAYDRQWLTAPTSRLALPDERTMQAQWDDFIDLPALNPFAQDQATNEKAEVRNPDQRGGMVRFLLI